MPLPDVQDIYKPVLEALRDEAPHNLAINDLINIAREYFDLGELSSIDRNLLKQKVTHAKKELKEKKFLTNPSNNTYIITAAGLDYLNAPVEHEPEIQEEMPVEVSEAEEAEVPDVIETYEPEPEVYEEVQPEYEEIEPEEEEQEEFEELADVSELDEVQDVTDEAGMAAEVQEEADGIQIEDEPEEISLSEETINEPSEENIIIEDEGEPEAIMTEEEESESEPELMPEPEPEPEPEQETLPEETETYETETYETENMNEDMNMNPSTGIEDAIRAHNEELAEQVLSKISELPSEMFEVFVIDLLSKMGYRAFHNARYTSEESGSNLIHGVIIDDKTGAPIYIHARKSSLSKTIGRADMQDFIDALSDKGGKGIFATTAKFSEQAEILANDERIMLIDGMKLAGLMIAHDFCVKVEKVYEIKGIDTENFSEYKR